MNFPKLIDSKSISKELQPGVISEKLLRKCIMADSFHGETVRLASEEAMRYEKVNQIRLEGLSK